tara:strand:+ start:24177 stop:24416 length:240 start_codon:yes stop_codon:yes gene_type:complete
VINDYEINGKRADDLDLPENARACLHRFFTNTPCKSPAVWYNQDTGSQWCDEHKLRPPGWKELTRLDGLYTGEEPDTDW